LNTPLAVPLTILSMSKATPTRMSRICSARLSSRITRAQAHDYIAALTGSNVTHKPLMRKA
jgi:hypothetical protein